MLICKHSLADSMKGLTVPKLHVLVVEDDPMLARALAKLLSIAGYVPQTAGSFREAVDAACHEIPDLLISDIRLPDKDGWQLLALLRRAYPGLRALAVSGTDAAADIARSRAVGFALHLIKPLTPDRLFEAIDAAFEI